MGECTICIEPISLENLAVLPCGHCFHHRCIETWGHTRRALGPTCPVCSSKFRLDPSRGIIKKIFLPGVDLFKTETLDAYRQAEEETRRVNERIEVLEEEQKLAETQINYLRSVEEKHQKTSQRFRELESELIAERESKKEETHRLKDGLRAVKDELSQKEAEIEVAEWETKGLKKFVNTLEKEIERERKDFKEETKKKDEEMRKKDEEVWNKDEEVRKKDEELRKKDEEERKNEDETQKMVEVIHQKDDEIKKIEKEMKRKEKLVTDIRSSLVEERRQFRDQIKECKNRLLDETDKTVRNREEHEEEVQVLRKKLEESEAQHENLAAQLRSLKDPILTMFGQMDDLNAILDQLSCHNSFLRQSSANSGSAVTSSEESFSSKGSRGYYCGTSSFHPSSATRDAEGLPDDSKSSKVVFAVECLRARDASFIVHTGIELTSQFNIENKNPLEDAFLEERFDELCQSPLSVSSLDSFVAILSAAIDSPHFNYFVRKLIDDLSSFLFEIFREVPVIEVADNETLVSLICSALRLMAFLSLGRVEDVEALLNQTDLVNSISRHLRFNVESIKVLVLAIMRVVVCRPALTDNEWFPSVSLLRSLLSGSAAVHGACTKFLIDSIENDRGCSTIMAQLSKEDCLAGRNSTLAEAF